MGCVENFYMVESNKWFWKDSIVVLQNNVTSGVPQGSCFGTFSAVHINHLSANIKPNIIIIIYMQMMVDIQTCDNFSGLYNSTRRLHLWAMRWQANFNPNNE